MTHRFHFLGREVHSVLSEQAFFRDVGLGRSIFWNMETLEKDHMIRIDRIFITQGDRPDQYNIQFPDLVVPVDMSLLAV